MATTQAIEQEAATSTPAAPPHETPAQGENEPPLDELLGELEKTLATQTGAPIPEAVEAQPEVSPPGDGETTPEGDDGESNEKPAVDYGAIPQAPVMGKDQEPMTIGQMKDEITERRTQAAKVEKLEFDLMRQRDMVNQILQNNGPLTDAQKQEVENMRQDYVNRQNQTVMDMFPEWQDPSIRNKVVPELTRIARSAGWSQAEVEGLTHPAVFNLLERVRRYEEREALGIKAMQESAKPRKEKGRSPQPPTTKAVRYGNVADRISSGKDQPEDWYALGKLLGVD